VWETTKFLLGEGARVYFVEKKWCEDHFCGVCVIILLRDEQPLSLAAGCVEATMKIAR
jgi:hypothetical protein